MRLIDCRHLGRERVIGAWLVDGDLVDPGPASCLGALLEGLAGERPRRLLLTHIHLDHAGAAGTLVRRWPELEVWVHERGARHLADPSRLLASAGRLYGADMDRLWGEVLAVPADRIRTFGGGEADGPWRTADTPGHASHHLAFLHEPSGRAFCGDVAGVRIPPPAADEEGPGSSPVLAPTPPPDIDLDAWRRSLQVLEDWAPESLAVTHFGAWEDVDEHLAALRRALDDAETAAGELDGDAYARRVTERVRAAASPATAESYLQAMPPEQLWPGLARYLGRS